MPTEIVLARYAASSDGEPVDVRAGRVDVLPAAGETWWYGDPYSVRSVSDDAIPRVEAVLDAERLLRFGARLPDGFALSVRRPATLGLWDAVVLNVEGGVAGYGRDPDAGDAAAEVALRDAGL